MLLVEAWQFIVAHPDRFFGALFTHIALSTSALSLAIAIALPAGVLLADKRRAALAAISAANIGRTLPSLAVLAIAMPILGTGFVPSLFALTLLALPPILINTCTAMRQVEPDVVDAALGMGMTRVQVMRKVELPIAMPVIFAGIRTAAVQVVSGAVLAAYIGGGGWRLHHGRHCHDGAAAIAGRRDSRNAALHRRGPAVRVPAESLDACRNARAMIEIRGLVKQFSGTARPAVDHLSLSIPEGEVCVLIGPSGCGKTTTIASSTA